MIEGLTQAMDLSQAVMIAGFFVFLRVGSMLALLPAFGEQLVPVRVKLALAVAFTMIVTPAVAANIPSELGLGAALRAGGAEVLSGLLFGVLLRFYVIALQIAGSIAAQSTSLSQLFGGGAGVDPQPAMGHLLVIAGLTLAAAMGLHVKFAMLMIQSYSALPFGVLISGADLLELGVGAVGACFALGFKLAAPFVVASLIYNVTLGVINRAMPQLMVAFVGAPAITAGGLILLLMASPLMLTIWAQQFDAQIATPFELIK